VSERRRSPAAIVDLKVLNRRLIGLAAGMPLRCLAGYSRHLAGYSRHLAG